MKREKSRKMYVYKKYKVNDILPLIKFNAVRGDTTNLEGFNVNINSNRLKCFKINLKCSKCERIGEYFNLEIGIFDLDTKKPHLNLYSIDDVLMTKDHIIPKSKGGNDGLDNLETMCLVCNNKKGDKIV